MRKPLLAQILFNLFDIQTESLSNYYASESRKHDTKTWMFDDNGDVIYRNSDRHRELYPEDFE